MNAGEREGRTLRAVLLERLIDEYGGEREDWTEMRSLSRVETAVLDWLRARLASDEVRDAVARALCESVNPGGFGWREHCDDWHRDAGAALAAVLAALEVER